MATGGTILTPEQTLAAESALNQHRDFPLKILSLDMGGCAAESKCDPMWAGGTAQL